MARNDYIETVDDNDIRPTVNDIVGWIDKITIVMAAMLGIIVILMMVIR